MFEYADLILLSNCIFTATEESPVSGYIAVKNERIISVGAGSVPAEIINADTKYLDYGDQMFPAGFIRRQRFHHSRI